MPRKTTDEKSDGRLLLSISSVVIDELTAVARANDCSIQELFRRAGRAIVRCHHEHGAVPMDMEIRQRQVGDSEIALLMQLVRDKFKAETRFPPSLPYPLAVAETEGLSPAAQAAALEAEIEAERLRKAQQGAAHKGRRKTSR